MSFHVDHKMLEAIWRSLCQPVPRSFLHNERCRVKRMTENMWIDRIDISDLLEEMDDRIRGIDIFGLANTVELPTRIVFGLHGNKLQRSFSGFERIHRADAAALAILLERLGFRVNPTEMVEAVLPSVKGARYATIGEMAVLRFASNRHKMPPLTFAVPRVGENLPKTKTISGPEGYKVSALLDDNENPLVLEFSSPRYRRQPDPVSTHCATCDMTYLRGDPEEGASHRREHAKYLSVAEPKPTPRAIAAQAAGWDGRVDASSPQWMHQEVYKRARLFRREFGYDFVQWCPLGERAPGVAGFLFMAPDGSGRIIGACCFRWREYTNALHQWAMAWIWLAPGARRTRVLSAQWHSFLRDFGSFRVEPPLSDAMQGFLAKYGRPEAALTPALTDEQTKVTTEQ